MVDIPLDIFNIIMPMITTEEMIEKLHGLYDKQEAMEKAIKKLVDEYKELELDIEMMETMVMYSSQKADKIK